MALRNPADVRRHTQFKKDVDDLRTNGYIRHYSSEISKKTGDTAANICHYYFGKKPIGDNFIEKFNKAYRADLKMTRKGAEPSLNNSQDWQYVSIVFLKELQSKVLELESAVIRIEKIIDRSTEIIKAKLKPK